MASSRVGKGSVTARMALGMVLGLSFALDVRAQPAVPQAAPVPAVVPTLGLSECLAIGLDRRPALTAARSSYDSALLAYRGIDKLPAFAVLARPDLPVRKQQTLQSIAVARAGVDKAQHDAIYDVTRMYYTYVYARQQELTAESVIGNLELFSQVVERLLKSKDRDPKSKINQSTLSAIRNLIGEIRLSALKAELGRRQALLALKEAMGGDFDRDFVPRDAKLPILSETYTKSQVIELAMSRRPELVMAAAGSEAFRLEICAQMKARGLQSLTLAAGRDIHSQQIPFPLRDGEYKPGGILPEMPSTIVGKREDRVARAVEISRRANAASEQVVILVRLEAETAFLTWEISTKRVAETLKRSDAFRKALQDGKLAAFTQMDPDTIMTNETAAGRALAEYAEATFEHLKTLATLERATGGGIQPAFPGR